MSAAPKTKLTPAEYLAIERRAEFKSEFWNGEMFPLHRAGRPTAMAGASREHNRVKENLVIELGGRLRDGPCQTFSSDQRVKVERTGLYTYPDVLIVCGPPAFDPDDRDTLVNPQVVIEVLSDSTARYDRTTKFRHYQQIPSLREYVLVAQDEPLIERFVRQPDDTWTFRVFAGLAGEIALGTIDVRVPLAAVFRGVEFPPVPPGGWPGGG